MSKSILQVKAPDITDTYVEDEEFEKELEKISLDAICNSNQTKVIKEIRKCLANTLRRKYGFTNGKLKELTTKILKIHGLDESNFDCIANFDKFVNSRLNDVSIDDNSNKGEKTVAGLHNEVNSSNNKLIGYHLLYQVMKELYGKSEAQKLSGEMYDYSLGLADSSKIDLPYCWAFDASKLVVEGRKFGQLPSAPAKRLDSYVSALSETVHNFASALAGACAISSIFLDFCHILVFKERVPFNLVKNNEIIRKRIENEFQKFVHSVNHLSRNGVESPFTNISVFDRPKLKYLIGKENYGWYFPNKEAVAKDNGLENKMSAEEWETFIVDYIIELQNIYLAFHNKGDPLNNGLPYRFPVVTLNISKDENNTILDEQFLKDACKLDAFRYNWFTSSGTKIASCCFKGEEVIKVYNKDNQETIISLKDFAKLYSDNNEDGKKINDEIYIDSYDLNSDKKEKTLITGVLVKDNKYEDIIDIKVDNESIKITPDHMIMVKDIETGEIKEITAEDLIGNEEKYLLPVE